MTERDPDNIVTCPRCGHEIRLVLAYGGKRRVAARHRSNRATLPDECVGCQDCTEHRRKIREGGSA